MKKAWRATWVGGAGIASAETRGQAVFRLFHELKEHGYKPKLGEIKCRRAPEHDGWAELDNTGSFWDERYLPCKSANTK
jgi:hypothetical protein